MSAGVRNTVLLCVAFIAVILGMLYYSVTREHVMSAEELRAQGAYVFDNPREIGPFNLVDDEGATFTNADLEGHWTFIFFGFTACPDVCPVALSVLAQVERDLLADTESRDLARAMQVVLVTADPERDDLASLHQYVGAFSDRFRAARGPLDATAEFAKQVNAAFMKVPSDDENSPYLIDHTAQIVVVNPAGHYHGFIKSPHERDKIEMAYRSMAAAF